MEFKDSSPLTLPDFSHPESVDANSTLHSPRSTLTTSNGDNSRLVNKDGKEAKEAHVPSAIDLATVLPSRDATEKETTSPPISPRSFFSSISRNRNTEKTANTKERQPIPVFRENANNNTPSNPSAGTATTASATNAENASCDGLGAGSGSSHGAQDDKAGVANKARAISSPQMTKKFARLEQHIQRKDSKELGAMSAEQRQQILQAVAQAQQQEKQEKLERERLEALKRDAKQSTSDEDDSAPFDDYTYSSHNIDIDSVGLSANRREEPTGLLPTVVTPTETTGGSVGSGGGGGFVKPNFKRTVSKQETIARESRRIGKWRNEVAHNKNAGTGSNTSCGPESPRASPSPPVQPALTTTTNDRIERTDSDQEKERDGAPPVLSTRPVATSRAAGIAQYASESDLFDLILFNSWLIW